jgi:tRNA (guanine-N7-)-methyltransferase
MEVVENEPTLINCSGAGKYCDLPARPETKFEQRGRRLGHGVWDLVFEKAGS